MIILFIYCVDVENYESFRVRFFNNNNNNNNIASSLQQSCSLSLQVLLTMKNISYNPS